MTLVAALFVDPRGPYFGRPDVDPWDQQRDARKYAGPWPVVAHPPCQLWVNLAAVNWKRWQKRRPAWYPGGTDDGCFASALAAVRRWGGVLEHPADSHAFAEHGLRRPSSLGWQFTLENNEYVCEMWQSAYGHRARKRTWLFYVGAPPFHLSWSTRPGTHQIGKFDRNKPTLAGLAAIETPPTFADALLELARCSSRKRAA